MADTAGEDDDSDDEDDAADLIEIDEGGGASKETEADDLSEKEQLLMSMIGCFNSFLASWACGNQDVQQSLAQFAPASRKYLKHDKKK